MATGEFVSVSSQNELVAAEVRKERTELEHNPESEQRELADMFVSRGVDAELAAKVAMQVSAHPEEALAVHVREELGVDHRELSVPVDRGRGLAGHIRRRRPDPAAALPAGFGSLPLATGALPRSPPSRAAGWWPGSPPRPFLRGALRQLLLAALAASLTYGSAEP